MIWIFSLDGAFLGEYTAENWRLAKFYGLREPGMTRARWFSDCVVIEVA